MQTTRSTRALQSEDKKSTSDRRRPAGTKWREEKRNASSRATGTALTHIPKLLGHRTHQQLLRTCPSDQPPTSIRQALFVDGSIGCQIFI
ncbi:hypothetical protein I7I50_05143 [Histoplasma capsulatum G186AR]|uniref:Uncharacterized protein n=1 Tax=Ajellomyces capsulatus TaxID=5037 RepID=A0A8H8D7X8_AJECA|nr:hypothetical protein I7I52_03401 [Histoplasma capsulatum]QSS75865.1 hypothetical protein I7I50_05143 [Histoplasma capsulatum G186AR]